MKMKITIIAVIMLFVIADFSFGQTKTSTNAGIKTGAEQTEKYITLLKGKRVAIVGNQTSVIGKTSLVDTLQSLGVNIVRIFGPEHGFRGTASAGALVADSVDAKTGIAVVSLYGRKSKPTKADLANVDLVIFDIQDVGARFYTYTTTMAYCMEAAAQVKIPFYVLDRPNPITGNRVEGPLLDAANRSFVGYMEGLPLRHGMTMGELARLFNSQKHIGAALTVIPMQDWERGDWFDSTNLAWINPSPNLRGLKAAILYPGIAMLEYSENLSVGRGTDAPFEQIGAGFIAGREFAAYLNKRLIPGVRAYPTSFTPTESSYKGVRIEGVRFEITNRELFDSTRLGLELAAALQKLYPGKIDFSKNKRLIGSDDVIRRLSAGEDARTIQESYRDQLAAFVKTREPFLLYR
jgi:uncharacterized protein YbbC (DUF1343 family)